MEKIKNCKVCNAEIASSATVCPSCGAKFKKPIFKRWWFWLIIIVILGGIGSAFSGPETIDNPQVPADQAAVSDQAASNDKDSTTSSVTPPASVEDFEIVGDLTTQSDEFAFYIIGTVKNNTDRVYSYAQITFNLYDSSGNQIGTALANVNNFEAGGTWKFKAMGMGGESSDVASYKFVGVDAF